MPDGSFPGQYGSNQYLSVPTQNRFGPLGEWVGYSMGINETIDESSEMEVQWIPVQNQKRKRFNTGAYPKNLIIKYWPYRSRGLVTVASRQVKLSS